MKEKIKMEKPLKVFNFSVISKDDEGDKIYTKLLSFWNKGNIPKVLSEETL